MFINPLTAINEGWITHSQCNELQDWKDRKFVSPNAIDFTADRAWRVEPRDFYISETHKQMRGSEPIDPRVARNIDDKTIYENVEAWNIPGKGMLDFLSNVYVNLPEGVAAQLIIRSTLARNGLILVSGLYDSGFKGHIGFLLHNLHDTAATISKGTRVGQIIFIQGSSAGLYAGGYNHDIGTELEYQK